MLLANIYLHVVLGALLFFTSIFMIFLVLIQRGRGGGLAGALGGGGGGSAFGAKAGDTFTWVTYGAAMFWFLLCILTIFLMQGPRVQRANSGDDNGNVPAVTSTDDGTPGTDAAGADPESADAADAATETETPAAETGATDGSGAADGTAAEGSGQADDQ